MKKKTISVALCTAMVLPAMLNLQAFAENQVDTETPVIFEEIDGYSECLQDVSVQGEVGEASDTEVRSEASEIFFDEDFVESDIKVSDTSEVPDSENIIEDDTDGSETSGETDTVNNFETVSDTVTGDDNAASSDSVEEAAVLSDRIAEPLAAYVNMNTSMMDGITVTSSPVIETSPAGLVLEDTSYSGTITGHYLTKDLLASAYQQFLPYKNSVGPLIIFNDPDNYSLGPKIWYTVYLPEGQEVTAVNAVARTSAKTISSVSASVAEDGKSVKFTLNIPWVDYNQFFGYYEGDLKDKPDAAFDFTIEFSGKAAQGTSASDLNGITGSGYGSFWYYRNRVPISEVMYFSTDVDKGRTYSLVKVTPVEPSEQDVNSTLTLKGDIRIGDNTESDQVYKAEDGEIVDLTGSIDVTELKKQVNDIASGYQALPENILLENIQTTFTAVLELPEGLEFTEGTDAVLDGVNEEFVIDGFVKEGNKATVTFKLDSDPATFKELSASIAALDDELSVTVSGIQQSADNTGGMYTVKGSFEGNLTAKAVHNISQNVVNYDLKWNAEQDPDGADAAYPGSQQIGFTMQYPSRTTFTAKGELKGDIRIGDETEHDKVYPAEKSVKMAMSGVLSFAEVKEQMVQIEGMYRADPENISLSDIDFSFVAELELPADHKFTENPSAVLSGDNGSFKVESLTVTGSKAEVVFVPQNTFADFKELKEAVTACDDELVVTLDGVVNDEGVQPVIYYTVRGSFEGNLTAKATNTDTGSIIFFDLNWTAVQNPEGADAVYPDSTEITFTMNYPMTVQGVLDPALMGDIRIKDNTEHDAVYEASLGDKLDITGALNFVQVKDQMAEIEAQYQAQAENITLSNTELSFTAVLELPDELDFADDTKVELGGDNGSFKITGYTVSGKKLTVTFEPSEESTTFAQLKELVNKADDELNVTVYSVVNNDSAVPETNYIIKGSFVGKFYSEATHVLSGHRIVFDLGYEVEQDPDGADAIALDSKNITFTLKYQKPEEKPEDKPQDKPDVKPTPTPKPATVPTGVESDVVMWSVIGLFAVISCGVFVVKRKQYNK